MIKYAITTLILGACFSVSQSHAQSMYMSDQSIGITGGVGFASNSASLSGTSMSIGYSLERTVDFSIAYDRFTKPEFMGFHSDLSGSVAFYPKKQWENDPLTLQVFATGASSSAPNRAGFSAALGTAVSTKMDISNFASFIPKTGFMFVPFRPGSPSQYSAITIDTAFTFNVTSGVRLLVSPGYQYEFGENTSNIALMGGIVL